MIGHSIRMSACAKAGSVLASIALTWGMPAPAVAGCGYVTGAVDVPTAWDTASAVTMLPVAFTQDSPHMLKVRDGGDEDRQPDIVGMWRFTWTSDGTAYPAVIPAGVVVDFGTSQWHSDGTEFQISGSRPPGSGDVCMGVWKQTGRHTFKLHHIALGWVNSDTPPPVGPVSPAAYIGPAIIKADVTISRSRNIMEGSFTIDQYAKDEKTLLQHVGGRIDGTRFTVD